MNTHETCTEEQASALAGVSTRTLQRFAEAGYLSVVLGEDGRGRYQRAQVEEIFNAAQTCPSAPQLASPESSTAPAREQATAASPGFDGTSFVAEQEVVFEHSPSSREAHRQVNQSQAALIEIEKFKNLLAIQERMLDAKDDEIADLKSQRAWLRERVEKLEEKSDRDQILLLSETQTIRSLIAYQESRKSTVRQLLEWMGFSRNPEIPALSHSRDHSQKSGQNHNGRTIEVRKAANAD